MQLPFEEKPWAKPVARAMIVAAVVGVAAALLFLHSQGPLDTGEITAAVLILLAVIPPNISVLRHKASDFSGKNNPFPTPH